MIRQNIIDDISASLQQSLQSRSTIVPGSLYGVQQCLSREVLQEIKNFLAQTDHSSWIAVQRQDYLARKSINWQPDSIIEELHVAIDTVTGFVQDLFGAVLHFHGIQLWKDSEGYNLANHYDNPIIDSALQIYLFDSAADLGTTFLHQEQEHVIPFENNTGYLVNNRADRALMHRTTGPVPAGHERLSLFAYWSLTPKAQ